MRLHIAISMYMRREKVNRDFVAMYKSRTAKSYINERPHTLKILIRNTCRLDFFLPQCTCSQTDDRNRYFYILMKKTLDC